MTELELRAGRLDDETAVLGLLQRAEWADGVPPVSEQAIIDLRRGDAEHLLLGGSRAPVAYAVLQRRADGNAAELVVDPGERRRGYGRRLAQALVSHAGSPSLRIWAHGNFPAAVALAAQLGFSPVRELRHLRRPGNAAPLPERPQPPGITLRTFDPERDPEAWLRLNATAFADHHEQGRWTADDLAVRITSPDFDPRGFLLAERDGELVGFHWTKLHAGPPLVGEVYVIGVHPSAQGCGLGASLLDAGLRILHERGARDVGLYVEAGNSAAIELYGRYGFTTASVDVLYERHD